METHLAFNPRDIHVHTLNVGGHLSLGRHPDSVVRWAAENGFRSMQFFASSPGAWRPPIVDRQRVGAFLEARREHDVEPVFIHAIYLINLASRDVSLVRRAKASLIATLEAGEILGAAAVVTHIGSHGGRGYEEVAEGVAQRLVEVVESAGGSVDLALENSAGAGGIIGAELGELEDLLRRCGHHPRLKIALDTAHLCASGWDFAEPGVAERLAAEVRRRFGTERLAVVHSNDSKVPCGSRKDRHANIGDGAIGLEGFGRLVAQPALTGVPWILETPNLEQRVDDLTKLVALWREAAETQTPAAVGPPEPARDGTIGSAASASGAASSGGVEVARFPEPRAPRLEME